VYFCVQALDSSGELKSGFLYGNNFWLGSRSQCLDIMNRTPFELAKRYILNNTRYRDPQNEFPPFQLNYFVAHIRHNSTLQYHINILTERRLTVAKNPVETLAQRESARIFLCTVTYGLACAPYLALRCLQQLAIEAESTRACAAEILHCDTYVDDILSGAYHSYRDDSRRSPSDTLIHPPLVCTRQRAATGQQLMGQLPASRVTPCPLFYDDVITLGLCLPASCSTNNISFVLEGIFRDRILLINDLYSVDLNLIQVKNLKDDHQWLLSGAIPFICVALLLTFVMMISGTIYDIFIYQTYLKTNTKTVVNVENAVGEMQMIDLSSSREKSKIRNVLMCFSVYTSTKTIFNTKLDTKEIAVVHGIRFLSMVWIIILHSVFYTVEYFDNKTWMLRLAEGVPIQVISNGTLSVDTYFFLSGFLLAYVSLKNKIDKERIKPIHYKEKLNEFFVSIMKRYIRLTPAYIMMIGMAQLISAWYDKTSQFYVEERPHETCAKYWWRNVLYIHNLFGLNTMCLSWSWYLSNDMQFYIIGLVFLILSTVYFYVAVVILGTILIASVILSGYISYIYEYVPTLDEQYRLPDVLYFPPWIQIGPYIIGMITGYIIRRFNKKITLKKSTTIMGYLVISYFCAYVLSLMAESPYILLMRMFSQSHNRKRNM
ncbi:Nose resistant to fluoxetine protein 6, partial [Trachymyrmex cornetzi]